VKKTIRLIATVVAITTLIGCDGFNPFALIFNKMGKDLTDPVKHSERMAELILDKPECLQYKSELLKIGKEASSLNGGFTTQIIKTKDAANKVGCSKQ
jgi:hypothetical protein